MKIYSSRLIIGFMFIVCCKTKLSATVVIMNLEQHSFNVTYDNIDSFYQNIHDFKNIEIVIANNLKLINFDTLFMNLAHLPKLTTLYLVNNNLTEISEKIGELTNLRNIYLDNNPIIFMPKNLLNLNLQHISLSRCIVVEMDSLMKLLSCIQTLNQLDLDAINLNQFPSALLGLEYIEGISLSNNNINSLPRNICDLKYLKYLNLSNNKFDDFPKQLKCLELDILQITPSSLWKDLDKIKVEFNNIRKIIWY